MKKLLQIVMAFGFVVPAYSHHPFLPLSGKGRENLPGRDYNSGEMSNKIARV